MKTKRTHRLLRTLRSLQTAGAKGFNLVEVTLAVAIIGIAITILLGMFPLGLRASRDANDYANAATIAMDILSTFQAGAASSFTSVNLSRFGTIQGAGTILYYCNPVYGTVTGTAGTHTLNLQSPWQSHSKLSSASSVGTTGAFVLFFDAKGQSTSQTGTGTGRLIGQNIGTLTSRPYYRAEIRIDNNPTPTVSANLTRITVEMQWPCLAYWYLSDASAKFGARPRVGSGWGSGQFTDRTATYFTEVTQIK
jgi:prepilin-type N-terminal cleavage/methylation domain-containing protein